MSHLVGYYPLWSVELSHLNKKRIVIIDDDQEMLDMAVEFLRRAGYEAFPFKLASEAFKSFLGDSGTPLKMDSIDVILSDVNMPEMDGLEFVARMKKQAPDLPVILVTAFGSIETAIEATKKGAFDYITKPFKLAELQVRLERAISYRNLKRENVELKEQVASRSKGKLIGQSSAMRKVFALIDQVSKAQANVLVTGDSGTGKEMVARAIHENGPRKNKSFVAINCAAIPAELLESELFGHAKGSFTGAVANRKGLFEEAEGGTIFLDEIGDMDMSLQAKLLRVIQEKSIRAVGENRDRPINVRIICATHKNLKDSIKQGSFREDLYYRLSVIPIHIPPLKERREDIPMLAQHFLTKYKNENQAKASSFSTEAIRRLSSAPWDGNVRELENIIERVVVLSNKEVIDSDDLPLNQEISVDEFFANSTDDLPTIDELEKRYIRLVLDRTEGKKEKAAQILGINRRTLYRKERDYGFVKD